MKQVLKLLNANERELLRLRRWVQRVNALEPQVRRLSDGQLAEKLREMRGKLQEGTPAERILPMVYAIVRETARRKLNMRHFDVQIMGAVVLHQGRIAEMATGEGKTLVAVAPLVLNSLYGKGVHLVTVNDYLARRDAMWMGPIYLSLGLKVGVLQHDSAFLVDWEPTAMYGTKLVPCSRKEAYQADVTYGTVSDFGFDYLRDNMVYDYSQKVQRGHFYAIVDEVDSILIDEARTPLIISGPAEEDTGKYVEIARIVARLDPATDVEVKEKEHVVNLTPEGMRKVERALGIENLYDFQNAQLNHLVHNALKARFLMHRDRDYVVKDGEVIIVDEFTGRLMFGRRYSDGLHQAIEAKEGVPVRGESRTLATITIQNYFRLYRKLAGMTGTAKTEEREFVQIYGMDVVVIPTNRPLRRKNYPDVLYKTERAKFRRVVQEIEERHRRGQPVLVGTTSIEKSERLSAMLKRRGIPHQVLNAKHHEREAEIVAQAGRLGAVTIATNMAGRGTDILLGGNPAFLARQRLKERGIDPDQNPELYEKELEEARKITEEEHKKVVELGGLHVIGTERHESRRIDNQLRGRAGRQGDPGSSQFFLSFEDDIMRRFGQDRIKELMEKYKFLDIPEDEPLEGYLLTRIVEMIQKRAEAYNFEIRRNLLRYDDVLNKQREIVYKERDKILLDERFGDKLPQMLDEVVEQLVELYAAEEIPVSEWRLEDLYRELRFLMPIELTLEELRAQTRTDALKALVRERAQQALREQRERLGEEIYHQAVRQASLMAMDRRWQEHLEMMTHLREGVSLRAYQQVDPLVVYAKEAFELFEHFLKQVRKDIVHFVFLVQVVPAEAPDPRRFRYTAPDEAAAVSTSGDGGRRKKVGRNDPCPCGSGKKYKKCCMRKDLARARAEGQ